MKKKKLVKKMRRFDLVDDIHEGARMVEHPEGEFVLYSDVASSNTKTSGPACDSCNTFGRELKVYSGKSLCSQCSSQKIDERTRADLWCPK